MVLNPPGIRPRKSLFSELVTGKSTINNRNYSTHIEEQRRKMRSVLYREKREYDFRFSFSHVFSAGIVLTVYLFGWWKRRLTYTNDEGTREEEKAGRKVESVRRRVVWCYFRVHTYFTECGGRISTTNRSNHEEGEYSETICDVVEEFIGKLN